MAVALHAHPNDFDRKRIERALKARRRYRYVKPKVTPVEGGYKIESPCCSRNIDPEGGVIDVALLLYDADAAEWRLFRKNHDTEAWLMDSSHRRLLETLQHLNADADRAFWQ